MLRTVTWSSGLNVRTFVPPRANVDLELAFSKLCTSSLSTVR